MTWDIWPNIALSLRELPGASPSGSPSSGKVLYLTVYPLSFPNTNTGYSYTNHPTCTIQAEHKTNSVHKADLFYRCKIGYNYTTYSLLVLYRTKRHNLIKRYNPIV